MENMCRRFAVYLQLNMNIEEDGMEKFVEAVDPNLSKTLCVWRNLWHDSDHSAKKALMLMFMKERY